MRCSLLNGRPPSSPPVPIAVGRRANDVRWGHARARKQLQLEALTHVAALARAAPGLPGLPSLPAPLPSFTQQRWRKDGWSADELLMLFIAIAQMNKGQCLPPYELYEGAAAEPTTLLLAVQELHAVHFGVAPAKCRITLNTLKKKLQNLRKREREAGVHLVHTMEVAGETKGAPGSIDSSVSHVQSGPCITGGRQGQGC